MGLRPCPAWVRVLQMPVGLVLGRLAAGLFQAQARAPLVPMAVPLGQSFPKVQGPGLPMRWALAQVPSRNAARVRAQRIPVVRARAKLAVALSLARVPGWRARRARVAGRCWPRGLAQALPSRLEVAQRRS